VSAEVVPIAKAETPAEIGFTGLRQYGGQIREEFLPALQGLRGSLVFREMRENDPVVGAILRAIEMLIRQVRWSMAGATDNADDRTAAEFVESCLYDMADTWPDTLASILTFLPFGFSVHEELYKRRAGLTDDPATSSTQNDGRVGWRKLAPRAQETIERWIFDEKTGEMLAAVQRDPNGGGTATLPWSRMLLWRTTVEKGNPEGRSILRTAYRPWYFKKRIEEVEGVGIERDLAGLPTIWVPHTYLLNSASAAEKSLVTDLEQLMRTIRRDEREGVILPMMRDDKGNALFDFKLLATGGTRQFNTTEIVSRYDARIAMTVLADFIMLGHAATGSWALSSSKTHLFATALGSWLDVVCETFNRYAIPRLMRLNALRHSEPPRLEHGDVESADLTELSDYLTKLVGVGLITPGPELERVLLRQAKLPESQIEQDLTIDDVQPVGDEGAAVPAQEDGEGGPTPTAGAQPQPGAPADPSGPAPKGASQDAVNASQLALSGVQVTSLLEVLHDVRAGKLPKASAQALIELAFALSPEAVRRILDPIVEGSEPDPEPPPPPTGGAVPPQLAAAQQE
jgi:hypothetical protein